ncbi:unnamed protein product, partial [Brachionus calyciflorus]
MQSVKNLGKRKRYKKKSWVWQYIIQSENGIAECSLCQEIIQFESSTSSLIWHLEENQMIKSNGVYNNKKIKLAIISDSEDDDDSSQTQENSNKYFEQEHKADYLSEKLDSKFKDWNLDEKVVDSGSNIKSALTKRGWYVPCTAYKLNLNFDDDGVLRQKEITYEEAKILESVNIFKKDLNEIISKRKTRNNEYETKIKLIQEVPTRWNSTFDMIDKVPSHVEFTNIEEYCLLFEKIKDLTEILSGSNYSIITIVFPAIFSLVNYELDCLDLRTYEIKKLKTELVNSQKGRFSFVLNIKKSYLTRAKQFIIDIYNENFNSRQSQISSSPLSNISNSTQISNESSSSNISSIGNSSSTQQSLILEEINLPNTPKNPVDLDSDFSLEFFRENIESLERLGEIVKVIFSIPATSVPSESAFSKAGDIQNEQSSRLNP